MTQQQKTKEKGKVEKKKTCKENHHMTITLEKVSIVEGSVFRSFYCTWVSMSCWTFLCL